MKKFKKLIALTCVAAMLIPTVAFAADPTSATGDTHTGNSVIENNNSVKPEYTSVDLPTIAANTYDFQIDRDKLLDKFDYESTHDADSYIYFKSEDAPATAVNNAETPGSLYLAEIKEVEDTSVFLAKFTGETLTGKLDQDTDEYYVWVPKADDKTRGEFARIDDVAAAATESTERTAAVGDIVEWNTDAAILREDNDSGSFIWDGKIYQKVYNKLSDTDAVKYVTVNASNEVTGVDKNLYVATGDDETVAVNAVTQAAANNIGYTAATTKYIDESDIATVENVSTKSIVVSVKVTMKNDTGLTYVQDKADLETTEAAALYFAIKEGASNEKAVENSVATAYYVLEGANVNTTLYQDTDGTPDAATGSYNYYQYENPGTQYNKVSFQIVADVLETNENATIDAKWDEYVDSLKELENAGVNTRPQIEVVYAWEVVEETETENVYADLAGENTYTTDGNTGWAESESAHTHTFTSYTDTICATEGCGYERTSQITNPLTLTKGSSTYYCAGFDASATLTSQNVYDANEYASNGASATVKASTTTGYIKSSGSYNIALADYDSLVADLETGTYVLAIVTNTGSTYTIVFTIS